MPYYNRRYSGAGGFIRQYMDSAPVMKAMFIANVGVYLFELLFGSMRLGGVPLDLYIQHYLYLYPLGHQIQMAGDVLGPTGFYIWQPVTYMFLHGGFWHIFFNMFALVLFGPPLEQAWGSRKTLLFYSICGLGGGIAYITIMPLIATAGPLLGASGAIFGLLAAYGLTFPDQYLLLYFFIPMKAKYAVLLFILLEIYSVPSSDGIGHLAHLGGAAVGIVYLLLEGSIKNPFKRSGRSAGTFGRNMWQQFQRPQRPQTPPARQQRRRFVSDDDATFDADYEDITSTQKQQGGHSATMTRVITQEDIDRILDKIAASGYQNLTEEEREILFEASKKMDEGH